MQIHEPITNCLACGGPVWDNRADKKNPKGPDFKCKDKACIGEDGYVTSYWLPKGSKATARVPAPVPSQAALAPRAPAGPPFGGGTAPQGPQGGFTGVPSWAGLQRCYQQSYDIARKVLTTGGDMEDGPLIAATATIFIQAMKINLAPTGQTPLDQRPPALDNDPDVFEG